MILVCLNLGLGLCQSLYLAGRTIIWPKNRPSIFFHYGTDFFLHQGKLYFKVGIELISINIIYSNWRRQLELLLITQMEEMCQH